MVRTYFASQMTWNNQEMIVVSGLKYTFPCFRFTSSAGIFVFPVPGLNPALGHRVFGNRRACRKSSDKYQNELIMLALLFFFGFVLSFFMENIILNSLVKSRQKLW